MTTYNQLELEFGARLENLSLVADFISGSMSQLGIEEGVFEVQLAVDEACTNAIKYAYSEEGGVITITCEMQGNDFVVTIIVLKAPERVHRLRHCSGLIGVLPQDLGYLLDGRLGLVGRVGANGASVLLPNISTMRSFTL